MDSSSFTEAVTENVQKADPTLAEIVVDEIEVEEVVVHEPPTNAPTASPTARPSPAPTPAPSHAPTGAYFTSVYYYTFTYYDIPDRDTYYTMEKDEDYFA